MINLSALLAVQRTINAKMVNIGIPIWGKEMLQLNDLRITGFNSLYITGDRCEVSYTYGVFSNWV